MGDVVDGYYVNAVADNGKRRPGREPTLPDNALSAEELARRNNRRRRNREAAQRVRERRLGKMQMLEKQVAELKSDHKSLEAENRRLKMRGNGDVHRQVGHQRVHRRISNTEIPKQFAPPAEIKQEHVNEAFQTVQPDESKILFTPGGTFVLTPLRQETVRFDFPEPEARTTMYHDNGDYNKVILNL